MSILILVWDKNVSRESYRFFGVIKCIPPGLVSEKPRGVIKCIPPGLVSEKPRGGNKMYPPCRFLRNLCAGGNLQTANA